MQSVQLCANFLLVIFGKTANHGNPTKRLNDSVQWTQFANSQQPASLTYSNISSVISCRRVELYFHSMLFTEMNRINLCKCGSFLHAYFTPSTIIHDGRKIVIPLFNSILKLFLQHWERERARNTGHFYHKMKNGNETIWSRPLHWAQKKEPEPSLFWFKPLKYLRGIKRNFYKIPDHLRSTWKINFQSGALGFSLPVSANTYFAALKIITTTT